MGGEQISEILKPGVYTSTKDDTEIKVFPYGDGDEFIDVEILEDDMEEFATLNRANLVTLQREKQFKWKRALSNFEKAL